MIYIPRTLVYLCLFVFSSQALAEFVKTQLDVWVNEAIVATYTFDDKNFLERQKSIARYFTSRSWIAYSRALNESKLPEVIKKQQYEVSAVATLPPEIKVVSKNRWQAVMPILVVYSNPQHKEKQNLEVHIEFSVAPSGQGIRGLAIDSLRSKLIQPPCQCRSEKRIVNRR